MLVSLLFFNPLFINNVFCSVDDDRTLVDQQVTSNKEISTQTGRPKNDEKIWYIS